MNTKYSENVSQPFVRTNFQIHKWREQLKQGINFRLKDESIFQIRRLKEEDIHDVASLEQKIFKDPWPANAFHTESQFRENSLAFIGIVANQIIAYSLSLFIFDEVHINNIAVNPSYRNKGYGKTMLWLILAITSQRNMKICHLEVRRSNLAAISLYKKFGFKIAGIRKAYYQNEVEDAILMSKSDL